MGYYNYLGVPISGGNGCDYATNALPAGWQRIKGGVPQRGDILVYAGNSANTYGHVAIYGGGTTLWHGKFSGNAWVHTTTSYNYNSLTNPYWGLIRPDWGSNTPANFPLEDGKYYYIRNRNAGRILGTESTAEGAKVVLNDKAAGNTSQMWKAVKHADGYSFISVATGYAMDVYGYSTENLTEIKQYAYHGDTNQRFKIIDRGDGYYSIHPICSGLGLDAYEAGTVPGTKIVQYGYHGGANMQWSFEPVSNDPIGNLDYITGMTGLVYMNGWALDKDLPTTPLAIHVYIGSGEDRECCAAFTADVYREDIASAYPGVGANHGFEQYIYTSKTGNQKVDVFAINIGGGTNNTCIGTTTVYIPPDSIKPIIDKAYIYHYDANGYTVVTAASDNIGIEKVQFATWHESQNKANATWYNATLNSNDGSYYHTINVADFDNKEGTYYTDVYVWDYAGNVSVYSLSQYIDRTAPIISERKAERIGDNVVKISCKASDNTGVISMYFPTWTEYNGQDDLKSDWETYYKGKKEGDWWVFYVYDYDHNYEKGNYTTHIYPYDAYNNHCSGGVTYSFANRFQPQTFSYGENTYELYNDLLTWDEAKAKCEALGGHLVTINSQGEQDVIESALEKGVRGNYFIGGMTKNNQPTWITGETFSYSNWASGEPNNSGGTEDKYEIYTTMKNWNDCANNASGRGFICEFEPQTTEPSEPPEEDIPEGLWIAGVDENGYTYTGKAIKPEIRVYDHDTRLQENKDYTVTYKNNTKVNDASVEKTAPTITIKGKGNYSSKESVTFKILPKKITDTDITVDSLWAKANDKVQKPVPTVMRDGKKLKNKTDFTVEYPNTAEGAYKEPGTYKILIKGKGGYIGQKEITFTITENTLMSKTTVSKIKDQYCTGSAITPAFTVKNGKKTLVAGADYTVSYKNNQAIGTATIILTGKGNYSGEKKVTFKIKGYDIKKAKVTGIPKSMEYTGGAITTASSGWGETPTLTMAIDKEEKTLTPGTDYTITYQKNSDKGTASIIFTGKNRFTGTLKKTFKINAYDIKVDSSNKVTTSMSSAQLYAKGGSKPKPVVKFGTTVLVEGKDYTLSYKDNTKVNDGSNLKKQPTVTIKGKGNFKGSIALNYTIEEQSLAKMSMTVYDKVYKKTKNAYKSTPKITDLDGKTLKAGTDYEKNIEYTYKNNVTLDDGTVRKAGEIVGTNDIVPAGTVIVVTVTGKGNYNSNSVLTGAYRIVQSDIKSAKVKIPDQIYTGKEIEPDKSQMIVKIGKQELTANDFDIVSYSNNIKKGTAKVTIKGKGNYGGTKTVSFKIKSKGFLWWWR